MDVNLRDKGPWWRFSPFIWIGIAVLLIGNIAFFSGVLAPTGPVFAWIVWSFNPLCWPTSIGWFFWGLVYLKAIHWWYGPEFPQKVFVFLIFAGLVFVIVFLVREILRPEPLDSTSGFLMTWYDWTVLGPWTAWTDRGVWSWKILIAPTAALTTIVYLIRFALHQRKERSEK